ncbi:MAG: GDP-L-fucose synthase [Flavobacteriaceae bacterium]|nr:GDP-L-fucose synthase [Flavobacteriaceae bacterium]
MNKDSKIFVAGHRGLVGSAICKNLEEKGYTNIITRTHKELDLTNQLEVEEFFVNEKPEYVFLAAAKVGGIVANNTYRAEFIYENMMIQNNVIHQSYKNEVKKLLFLGSTCIYPKDALQPMTEDSLLTNTLEYTNEPYAIAKIAGIKMCESYNIQYGTNFLSVMPTNLYGPNDNFDLEKSHVLPALIRKIHLAKLLEEEKEEEIIKDLQVNSLKEAVEILKKYGVSKGAVEIWGSGEPMREFLWSEDMADACVYLMEQIDFKDIASDKNEIRNTHINIGTGTDISIENLAILIKKEVGYTGNFTFNTEKPDGTMRKVTDVSKLNSLGWKYKTELKEGIKKMYNWYLEKTNVN